MTITERIEEFLARRAGRDVRSKEIVRHINVSESIVSRRLRALHKAGRVRRVDRGVWRHKA